MKKTLKFTVFKGLSLMKTESRVFADRIMGRIAQLEKNNMEIRDKSSFVNGLVLLVCIVVVLAVSVPIAAQEQDGSEQTDDLLALSMEQLMNIEVASTATLTETKPRLVPAAITTVTAEQIQSSGARSLFELLDIYVPNLQWMRHHWEPDVMGLRGIISDRDDKYLLLVNGRSMNQRSHFGALSEQDLVLLSDIHHIDIVRGPGSALYGPGAVSMVINIITFNAETFQGTAVTSRLGAVEEFYSGELKHGQVFDDNDGGLFLYAGTSKYVGASLQNAPQFYPFTFPEQPGGNWPGEGTEAGEPMTNAPLGRDGEDARHLPAVKLHAQILRDNWDIWARYTRGGKKFTLATGPLARSPYGWANETWAYSFYAYQQATGYVGYKQELTQDIDIDYAFSYDLFDFDKYRKGDEVVDAYREDEYYGKILLRWQPNEQHRLAFGSEISHLELGLDGIGWPDVEPTSQEFSPNETEATGPMPRWSTNLYSLLGEHQWTINDKWTTFIGARLDDHTYTDWMFSPRAAIVHTPTDIDTIKLMWSRSVRANFEAEMKRQAGEGNNTSKPEKLDSMELRYERKQSENLDLAASAFIHYNLNAISWDQSLYQSVLVGTQREYGFEIEASYHTEKTRVMVSHGYTKLYSFSLETGQTEYISAKPYGYGNDLTNWSNNITKLTAQHKLNDQWTFDATLRIYWGFPGMKDFDTYYPYTYTGAYPDYPVIEEGWQRAYRGSYYLNLGLQYEPSKDLTIGVTGYNLLGIFDKDLNKRNYIEVVGNGDFRNHSPAVGVSLQYKF